MRRLYSFLYGLHLYLGLFVSPFVIVFAVSVFFLVHSWIPGVRSATSTRTVSDVPVPERLERLTGREQVDAAQALVKAIGVSGEIGFVRQFPKERRFVLPVTLPGREITVDVRVPDGTATVTTRNTGVADATVYLHKMPGPHNVAIRGNSAPIAVWRWLADLTVYLILMLTVTGIYLWAVLKAERRVGISLLGAGALTFSGLIYALVR